MSELPEGLRRDVIIEVYRQAAELDWDGLTDKKRTAQYNQWLDDPKIGGQLARYLHRDKIRYWLKDVPMKEYARARSGIGPLADFVSIRLPGPGQIARQVMGAGWSVLEDTIREKPNRCVICDGHEERLMMWGPAKTLRDLVWAGINTVVDGVEPAPLLVVASPQGHELGPGEKTRHAELGHTAGLEVRHTVLRVTRVRLLRNSPPMPPTPTPTPTPRDSNGGRPLADLHQLLTQDAELAIAEITEISWSRRCSRRGQYGARRPSRCAGRRRTGPLPPRSWKPIR